MGHVGLANYAGLTVGPLLAQALSGEEHPSRVWVTAVILPLVAAAFFAYFDAGVGLGGPIVGLAARAADPTGGLIAAAGAVLATAPVALVTRSRARTRQLQSVT
jgi:hypothetical protein